MATRKSNRGKRMASASASTSSSISGRRELSKKEQAIRLIARMQNRKNPPERQDVLDQLVKKVHLTEKGAVTYYQNIVNGTWH